MPRKQTTIKSERHAELGRRSIAERPRDAKGRLLPRPPGTDTPATGAEPPAVAGVPLPLPPASSLPLPPDPTPARGWNPITQRRAR